MHVKTNSDYCLTDINIYLLKNIDIQTICQMHNLSSEVFVIKILLSIYLSILAFDKMMQPRQVNYCVGFISISPMVMWRDCSSWWTG